MNIQSISVVVPTKGCVNDCKFCVSRMHENDYPDIFDDFEITKRLKFAVRNGVNTLVITGSGEPLQNKQFLHKIRTLFMEMDHPFPNVEFQTSGVMLSESEDVIAASSGAATEIYPNIDLLKLLGVNTISLSVSDIFDSKNNWKIAGAPTKMRIPLPKLCKFIKDNGFNLRLSLNMTNVYDDKTPEEILKKCKELGADQITFRRLYHSDDNSEQSKWVKENSCNEDVLYHINEYISGDHYLDYNDPIDETIIQGPGYGTPLYRLPFGPMAYSIMGMSTVIDDNCMNKESLDALKYVILREDGKLYSQWDDKGSLIF